MKRRWLINLVLLVAVAVLAMLMRDAVRTARSVPELTDLVPADVYEVEIARRGEPTIRLQQDLLGWRMEAPMRVDADDARIEKLLAILKTPVRRSFPKEVAALSELELEPPRLELKVDALSLEFGGIDPLGQSRYVASGGLIHLITDRFYPLLIAPPIDYVSPKLLPRDFNPVFGRVGGVPLTNETVTALNETVAERVAPLTGDLSGTPVVLKTGDGTTLRFVVSDDRRRWARVDQHLLYVLTDGPELALDPNAVDPTPAAPVAAQTPRPILPPEPMMPPTTTAPGPVPEPLADPFSPIPTEKVPYTEPVDPNGIVPGNAPISEPPVVKLTPDGREIPMSPPSQRPPPRLPPEDSANPYGFGVDPFAPDPAAEPAPAPSGGR